VLPLSRAIAEERARSLGQPRRSRSSLILQALAGSVAREGVRDRRARSARVAQTAGMMRADEYGRPVEPIPARSRASRSLATILAATTAGALIGSALALSTPATYDASVQLRITPPDQTTAKPAGAPLPSGAVIDDPVRMLTAPAIMNRVVDRLKLESDPEFNGGRSGPGLEPLGYISSLFAPSETAVSPEGQRAIAIRNLGNSLSVERGDADTIIIRARSHDGGKAARIANAVTAEFIAEAERIRPGAPGSAGDRLDSRLSALQRDSEDAERKAKAFMADNGVADITDEEIAALTDRLSTAKARTLQLNGLAESARALDAEAFLKAASSDVAGAIPALHGKHAAARLELNRLAVTLGPKNPQYQAMQAQVRSAREQLLTELRRVGAEMQAEATRAAQMEQDLAGKLAQMKARQGDWSGKMATLLELESEATTKRAVYEAFQLLAREGGAQKGSETDPVRVIAPASTPAGSSILPRALIAGTGALLGLLAGIGIAALGRATGKARAPARARREAPVAEAQDHTAPQASPEPDATAVAFEEETLQAPFQSALPDSQAPETLTASLGEAAAEPSSNTRVTEPPKDSETAARSAPRTRAINPTGDAETATPEQKGDDTPLSSAPLAPSPPADWHYTPSWERAPTVTPRRQEDRPPAPASPTPPPLSADAPTLHPELPTQPPSPQPEAIQPDAIQPEAIQPEPTQPEIAPMDEKSLSEIRESIRQCRDAVRELSQSRTRRRYF